MDTELKVLKKIFEEKEKAHTKSISNYLGFSQDYIRFLCQRLVEKDLLMIVARDWYKINQKGKKELRLRNLIEAREKRLRSRLEKLVWAPLRLREFPRAASGRPKFWAGGYGKREANQKLKLGEKIEKTAFSLARFRS